MTAWSRATSDDGRETFVFVDEGHGPLVVLIHGFPDTPHGYERIAAALVDAGHRVVRPWLRGYHPDTIVEGRSYDLVTISSDPIHLLDALGERDAILAGHDWGSGIVFGAAALHPDRVRAIVPIALPHPNLLSRGPRTLWAGRHFVVLKLPWAEAMIRGGDFAYLDKLYRRWAPDWRGSERDRTLAHAKEAFADPRALKAALDYYRAVTPKPKPELSQRSPVPGLLVADLRDIPRESYDRSAELLGEGSEVLALDGVGHWPHREREPEFIARLSEFVQRHA
jgi:pimeloyl-ACP methyl ester carboxylesterase